MRTIRHRLSGTPSRRVGALAAAASLVLGGLAPGASAATPLPPPEVTSIDTVEDDDIRISWRFVGTRPEGPYGRRLNVYIEPTGERVYSETSRPRPRSDFRDSVQTVRYNPTRAFGHGGIRESRYCLGFQSYVGDGTNAGSVFSAEGNRMCVGTQKIQIITPAEPPPPPKPVPPTRPDLAVTRVTGPTEVLDGATAVYEVSLWNEGTPAKGTAQLQINALSPVELVEMVETPDGFTCELGELGFSCTGSLGGVDDPVQVRGALFKVQVRGNGTGSASVYGSANHDVSLDEMTLDNNLKTLAVTVK